MVLESLAAPQNCNVTPDTVISSSYYSGYGFGHGSVTVLVTIANVPPSPLIAQLIGLIAFIHSGNVAVCHSCSLSVSEVLGGSSDPRVGGSSPSGRTIHPLKPQDGIINISVAYN